MTLTLITPAAGELVTLAEMKEQMRVDHDDDDALITSQIAAATGYLDGKNGVLGRCLLTSEWTYQTDGFYGWMPLPFPDVSAVAVTYIDPDGAEQTIDPALFEIVARSSETLLRLKPDFTAPALDTSLAEPVKVTFMAGYGAAASDVPASLVQAVKLLAAHWYENREAVTAGGEMADLPLGVRAIIAPYRMVGV